MKEPSTIFPDMPPTSMCNNDKDHGGIPKNEDRAGLLRAWEINHAY